MNANAQPEITVKAVEPCELSSKQQKQWADTMSLMAWTAPGFRHIFYKLLNQGDNKYTVLPTRAVPVAATDARNIMVNPDTFFEFTLPERTFVVGHEIIHNVYGDVELLHRCAQTQQVPMHDGGSRAFNNDTMQRAMDARINALLVESKIGKSPKKGHFDDKVTGSDSVLDVYKGYYDEEFPNGPPEGGHHQGPGTNPGGFDTLAAPGQSMGQSPQQAAAQRNPQQWAVEIAAAQTIEQMRSQGRMAAGLKRFFKQLLEPEVPWADHIQTLINRTVGDGGYDWNTPDEWFVGLDIYQPKPTGRGAGWIVVWGDTSGSRSDQELASNMAELAGMMADINPQRITVLWCDAEIGYIDEITDPMDLEKIRARGAGGGGGTSLEPVMDWIAQNADGEPDLFIGFTDGYVSFPEREPRFPVIWASSTDHAYPFGQVVRVNKRKQ